MSIALKLSDELVEMAKTHAAAAQRSVPKQIEYWARLGKAVDDNPELPPQFIKDTLLALDEAKVLEIGQTKRLGFMAGQIAVPDDFDRMGSTEIESLFGGRK